MRPLASIEIDTELSLVPFRTELQAVCLYKRIVEDPDHVNGFGENIANAFTSPDELLATLHDPANDLLEWYVMQHTNGIVGSVIAKPINERMGHYDIGYWVGGDYVRRGYAKRSVKALVNNIVERGSVQMVTGVVHVDNIYSRAVLLHAGLTDVQPSRDDKLIHQLDLSNRQR
jgi:RimJ/RimL family protein N-acetyltransferase